MGSTWVGGSAPGTNDNITIATTTGNSVTLTANAACTTLTINASATLNGSTFEINVKGAGTPFVNSGTFNPGTGTFTHTSSAVTPVTIVPGTYHNMKLAGTSVKNIPDGLILTGTLSGSSGVTVMTTGLLTIGESFTHSAIFNAGTGKILFTGKGSLRANTYHDLEISGADTITTSTITVKGTLKVGAGATFLASTATRVITLYSTGLPLDNQGNIPLGIINYADSTGNQIIAPGSYYRITLANAGTKTILTGALVETDGNFIVGSPLIFEGNGSAIIGGTLSGSGPITMDTGTLTFLSTFTNTGLFTPGQGTAIYAFEGDQTINASTYHNLQTTGAGVKTFEGGTTTVSGNFIVGDSTALGTSTDLYIDGNITGTGALKASTSGGLIALKGNWDHSGPFDMNEGPVIYEGINQGIRNIDYYTLELSNGIKTISEDLTISKKLTINPGSTLDIGSHTLNIAAPGSNIFVNNGTLAGTGTVHFSNADVTQTIPATTYYNLQFSGLAKTFASGTTIIVQNDWDVNSTVTMTGSQNAEIAGDILGSGDITMGSGTIRVSGDWLNNGVFTKGTGTIIFEGGIQTIPSYTYNFLEILNGGVKKLAGDIMVNQILTVSSPAILNADTATIILTKSGVPFDITGNLTGTGTVRYTASGTQTIADVDYHNLELDLGSKIIPTGADIVIANDLDITGTGTTTLQGDASIDVGGDISGNTTLTLNTGMISIDGDWTKTGAFNPGSGIVVYEGETQLVAGLDYFDLVLENTGTKSLQGDTNIGNTLLVSDPVSFDLGTHTLNLIADENPLQVEGSLIPSTSTVNYSNAAETTIAVAEYYNLNSTGGERIISPDGTVSIAGVFTPGSGPYTVENSIVNFNGSAAQVIPAFTFHRLILSGTDDKSIITDVVTYDLEVQGDAVLNIEDSGEITITKP